MLYEFLLYPLAIATLISVVMTERGWRRDTKYGWWWLRGLILSIILLVTQSRVKEPYDFGFWVGALGIVYVALFAFRIVLAVIDRDLRNLGRQLKGEK